MSGGGALQRVSKGYGAWARPLVILVMIVAGLPVLAPQVAAASTASGSCSISGSTVTCTPGSGTYTPDSTVACVKAEAWGGGGGGGGVDAATGFGGGGGGGGAYARRLVFIPSTIPTYAVTVGAGGTAGPSTGPGGGGAGGDSVFADAATVVAKGGLGGQYSTSGTTPGGAGGSGSTGATTFNGGAGAAGTSAGAGSSGGGGGGAGSSAAGGDASGATGGSGGTGGGGNGANGLTGTNGNGNAGSAPGGGGSGGNWASSGSWAGGAGGAGRVVLTEYGDASTLGASPASVQANNVATSTVTVTLNSSCLPSNSGQAVTLVSDRGTADTIAGPSPATTNAAGETTFTVQSGCAGTATLRASVPAVPFGVKATATVTFTGTVGAVTAAQSTLAVAPSSQYADNLTTSTITVTLRDAAGCPVQGKAVSVASSRLGADTIATVQGTTDAGGRALFTVRSGDWTTNGGVSSLTATDTTDGIPLGQVATVTWAIPVKGLAFVTQPSDSGQGIPFAPTVRVMALDGAGNPFTAAPVAIRLQLTGGPAGARLVNGPGQTNTQPLPEATTVQATGIATFPGMAVDRAGTYRLQASAGLATGTSGGFVVGLTGAAWPVFHRDPGATGASLAGKADMSILDMLPALNGPAVSSFPTTPLIVDVDADGDLDVVAASSQSNTPGAALSVMAYKQSGGSVPSAASWATPIPSTMALGQPATDGTMELAAADLDGDGTTEIAVYSAYGNAGFGNGALRVLRASDGALLAGPVGLTIGVRAPMAIGNVDGDAQPEIVLVHSVGGTNSGDFLAGLSYASGTLTLDFDTRITGAQISWSNPVLVEADPTHAGLEVIVGHDGGNAVGRLWFCRPVTAAPANANCGTGVVASDGVRGLAVADLDGDGWPELTVNERTTLSGTRFALQVWRIQSTAPYLSLLASDTSSPYQWNSPAVGDVNGDGTAEIVNVIYSGFARTVDTNRDGHVFVRGYGSGTINALGTWSRPGSPSTDMESVGGGVLVPVDAATTSSPRFVFGSADGRIHAAVTTPAGSVGQSWNAGVTGATSYSPPSVGDLTGDCRPEVAIGASTGSIALLSGIEATAPTAPPSFATPTDFTLDPAQGWAGGTSPGNGLQAKLAWNPLVAFPAAGFEDGGLPVVAYDVYRATGQPDGGGPTGAFVKVGTWPTGTVPTAASPFIDDLADEGPGDYYYQVAAVTCYTLAYGPGPMSATFYSEVKPPQAPAGLASTSNGATPVKLTWNAPATPPGTVQRPHGCGPVSSFTYSVYRRTPAGGPGPIAGAPIATGLALPSPEWTDFTSAYGTSYDYEVTAVNCVGESPRSNLVTVSTANAPPDFSAEDPPAVLEDAGAVTVTGWASGIGPGHPTETNQRLKFTVQAVSLPALFSVQPSVTYGTFTASPYTGMGTLTYTLAQDACGASTFQVILTDDGGTPSNPADDRSTPPRTYTITVTCVDDPPIHYLNGVQLAGGESRTVLEAIPFSFTGTSRFTVTEPDAGTLTGSVSVPAGKGTLSASGTGVSGSGTSTIAFTGTLAQWNTALGALKYTSPALECGAPYTTLTLRTTSGALSDTDDVTLNVSCANRPPTNLRAGVAIVGVGTVVAPEDTDFAFAGPAALSATDPDSTTGFTGSASIAPGTGTLSATGPGLTGSGTPTLAFTGSLSAWNAALATLAYRAPPDACGAGLARLTLVTDDGGGGVDTDDIAIDVTCTNDAPVANGQTLATPEDTAKAITLAATDIDQPPQSLTYSIVTPPARGSLSGVGASRSYLPNLDFCGSDSFTFRANDGVADSNVATVTVNVQCVNDPPVGANDLGGGACYFTTAASAGAVGPPGILANDRDPDGDALTATGAGTLPAWLTVRPDGGLLFQQPPAGHYVFQYTVTDPGGLAAGPYTVCLEVVENQPPVAAFTAPAAAAPGQLIGFTDASTDADGTVVAWLWEFGDGTTSTAREPSHAYAAGGTYRVRLTVFDNHGASSETSHDVAVAFAAEVRDDAGGGAMGPVVDAGPDQSVPEGSVVRLAAVGPATASYSWRQVEGPAVDLRNPFTETPGFAAPLTGGAPRLVLRFAVVGTEGRMEGPADTVLVTVLPANRVPVARAGTAMEVEAGAPVVLDGSGSSDADRDPLTYTWRQLEGIIVDLREARTARPAFTAPDRVGELRFQLTVSDGKADATDTVVVVVRPAVRADAGFTAERRPGDPLTVVFTATAREGEAVWEFGDGTSATGLQAVHTYASPDTYNVTLRHRVGPAEASAAQPIVLDEPKSRVVGELATGTPWVALAGLGALLLAAGAVALVVLRRRRQQA